MFHLFKLGTAERRFFFSETHFKGFAILENP